MADHTVGAQDELHEREAGCTSVFCNDMLLQKVLLRRRSDLIYFAMSTSFCIAECQ